MCLPSSPGSAWPGLRRSSSSQACAPTRPGPCPRGLSFPHHGRLHGSSLWGSASGLESWEALPGGGLHTGVSQPFLLPPRVSLGLSPPAPCFDLWSKGLGKKLALDMMPAWGWSIWVIHPDLQTVARVPPRAQASSQSPGAAGCKALLTAVEMAQHVWTHHSERN